MISAKTVPADGDANTIENVLSDIWTCDNCQLEGNYYRMVEHTCTDEQDDSIFSIRLYNTRQVAADLAERLNNLHREACTAEPYLAELLLPLIGDANRTEQLLARWLEVR